MASNRKKRQIPHHHHSEDIIWPIPPPARRSSRRRSSRSHSASNNSSNKTVSDEFISAEDSTKTSTSHSKIRLSLLDQMEPLVKFKPNVTFTPRDKGLQRPGQRKGSISSPRSFQTKSGASIGGVGSGRITGGGNPSILMDWYYTSGWTHHIGFDIQLWWRRSSPFHRINAGLVAFFLAISILNLIFGVYCIVVSVTKPVRSPYVCETADCKKAAIWIHKTMNMSVDPCSNFYEFVCGNYKHEIEKKGDQFDSVIKAPGFPVAFGENSILARILRNFKNDETFDQPIKYYQACLNIEKRKEFGMEAFLETVEYVFGTRDFKNFENTSLSMEEIGSRMFQVLGHASFINMAFFSYPFIQILRPSYFAQNINYFKADENGSDWKNAQFIQNILKGFLPHLGIQNGVQEDSKLGEEIFLGIQVISNILDETYEYFHWRQASRRFLQPVLEQDSSYFSRRNHDLRDDVQQILIDPGFCPPMGIQMDIEKVLRLFIREDFRLDFVDLMAARYFRVLKICFEQDPKLFTIQEFAHRKTAFVGMWLIELFWDYHRSMDSEQILGSWNISCDNFPANLHVHDRFRITDNDEEFRCLVSLYRDLGYMPSIRYLLSITDNPAEFIGDLEDDITKLYHKFSDIFQRIPPTEMDAIGRHLGQIQFSRDVYVDVGLPFVSGLPDHSSVADKLPFTDDHLRNAIIATKYTIEKARQNWIGSTNSPVNMKWWGSGGPGDMRSELLDLREPMHLPALFVETKQPGAGKGKWEKFLGRGYPNYLLYPLALIGEPHVSETLALHFAWFHQKMLRSFLALNEEQFCKDRYPSLELDDFYWVGSPETDNNANRPCSILFNEMPPPPPHLMYTYSLTDTYTTFNFTYFSKPNFYTILALKEALGTFRKELKSHPHHWSIPGTRMQRYLPGSKMSKFSEEQLYFIAFVRHTCRGSWKTHDDSYKKDRWLLETQILVILMQMEEFADVWKCQKNDFMNNLGKDRCFRWMPT